MRKFLRTITHPVSTIPRGQRSRANPDFYLFPGWQKGDARLVGHAQQPEPMTTVCEEGRDMVTVVFFQVLYGEKEGCRFRFVRIKPGRGVKMFEIPFKRWKDKMHLRCENRNRHN